MKSGLARRELSMAMAFLPGTAPARRYQPQTRQIRQSWVLGSHGVRGEKT